jgi:hypothetical protein
MLVFVGISSKTVFESDNKGVTGVQNKENIHAPAPVSNN